MSIWSDEQKKLLCKWVKRISNEAQEYKYYGIVYTRTYYIFGSLAVMALAIFSTTGFVAIAVCPQNVTECTSKTVIEWLNVGFDALAAILIALFTFLDFSGHAEKCRARKIDLDALARTIEESYTYTENGDINTNEWIHRINEMYHEIQKKQIIVGLSWLCMSKKDIMRVHPLDQTLLEYTGTVMKPSPSGKSHDIVTLKDNFQYNKFANKYQLERLNNELQV